MRNIFFIAVMAFASITLCAQDNPSGTVNQGVNRKYDGFDFRGRFAAVVEKSDHSTSFLLDFSKLPTRFERVYLMTLSFENYEIVNVDPDISGDRVCFMANRKYKESEIIAFFDEIRERTSKIASSMTAEEKEQWLKEHDKYK